VTINAGRTDNGRVRKAFAHEAVVAMAADADVRAPGAAVTVALCGHWDHEPPCPVAPHHTAATRDGGEVRLSVLFVATPADEPEVRTRIEAALAAGQSTGPGDVVTAWSLVSSAPGEVSEAERAHAARLAAPN